jgi:hypothetical protein
MEYCWYLSAVLTEMYRSQRCAAAILFYEYFGSSLPRPSPGPYHFGVFSDVESLQLQPGFEHYMTEAFKPLGVYINFWGDGKPSNFFLQQWGPIRGGADHEFSITMINDDGEPADGKLALSIETEAGAPLAAAEASFHLAGLGREVYKLSVPIPKENGKYFLKAVAYPKGTRHKSPTICRRKVSVQPIP